jgi:hypothetical protein
MRRFAKPLYGLTPVPRVRIPPSPPVHPGLAQQGFSGLQRVCNRIEGFSSNRSSFSWGCNRAPTEPLRTTFCSFPSTEMWSGSTELLFVPAFYGTSPSAHVSERGARSATREATALPRRMRVSLVTSFPPIFLRAGKISTNTHITSPAQCGIILKWNSGFPRTMRIHEKN